MAKLHVPGISRSGGHVRSLTISGNNTVCLFLLDLRGRERERDFAIFFSGNQVDIGPKGQKEEKINDKWIKFRKRYACQFLVGWLTFFWQPSGYWAQKTHHQKKKMPTLKKTIIW